MKKEQFFSIIHQIIDHAKRAQLELAVANINENDPRWEDVEERSPIATFKKAFGVSLCEDAYRLEYNFEARRALEPKANELQF